METIRTQSWAEFESTISTVRERYSTYSETLDYGKVFERKVGLLFRGQVNAEWSLSTTLERKSGKSFDVLSYMSVAIRCRNELESYTGNRWNIPEDPELETEVRSNQDIGRVHLPAYDYLVYLRQHGFPSPLLDWTESPYIAAYFAFLDSGNSNPAVYCFIERPSLVKGGIGGEPMISVRGPFVSTDKRHFAQKAWYTVATKWDYKTDTHVFSEHEKVFAQNNKLQDVLVKIVLPASARTQALRTLNDYNINHFTLFQTEDALVKALETKCFDLLRL